MPVLELPQNYQQLVHLFYADKKREEIEEFQFNLQKVLKGGPLETMLRLIWDDEKGLISINTSGAGFNLNDSLCTPKFIPNNIETYNGYGASILIQKYIHELLKIQEKIINEFKPK